MKKSLLGYPRGKYPRTKEYRETMSSIKVGIRVTEKTKKKISDKIKWMNKHDIVFIQKCKDTNHKKSMPGEKNPMYGKKRPDVAKRNKENPLCGPDNPSWRGGKSYEPYGFEFNKKLKATIKKRDDYICMECGKVETIINKYCVHHIDYDKNNNNPDNLITLCFSCHGATNFNRKKWEEHYKLIMYNAYG